MGKVIRLNESDIQRIVKKVLNEQGYKSLAKLLSREIKKR